MRDQLWLHETPLSQNLMRWGQAGLGSRWDWGAGGIGGRVEEMAQRVRAFVMCDDEF